MLEVIQQDFVRTARAKGVGERRVVWVHALRNASITIVTVLGMQIGYLLGGSVITEAVFSWPGLGQMMVRAIQAHDYPMVQGGMRQRVMIAMAMACAPSLLLADEPTTALDVTVQAQILDLMIDLKNTDGAAILLITHDMGVIAEMAQKVAVMYAGVVMEEATVGDLFDEPLHPYTQGLLESIPHGHSRGTAPKAIPGIVPNLLHLPTGCRYRDRCPAAHAPCARSEPPLYQTPDKTRRVRRWLHHPEPPA